MVKMWVRSGLIVLILGTVVPNLAMAHHPNAWFLPTTLTTGLNAGYGYNPCPNHGYYGGGWNTGTWPNANSNNNLFWLNQNYFGPSTQNMWWPNQNQWANYYQANFQGSWPNMQYMESRYIQVGGNGFATANPAGYPNFVADPYQSGTFHLYSGLDPMTGATSTIWFRGY